MRSITKGAGFASRSFSEGLGDDYMKNKAEKMVNSTTRYNYL
jgi:hypothetical protein